MIFKDIVIESLHPVTNVRTDQRSFVLQRTYANTGSFSNEQNFKTKISRQTTVFQALALRYGTVRYR